MSQLQTPPPPPTNNYCQPDQPICNFFLSIYLLFSPFSYFLFLFLFIPPGAPSIHSLPHLSLCVSLSHTHTQSRHSLLCRYYSDLLLPSFPQPPPIILSFSLSLSPSLSLSLTHTHTQSFRQSYEGLEGPSEWVHVRPHQQSAPKQGEGD